MARPTNALIVDDEAHVRMFLRLLLKQLGVTTVWEAGDGVEALERAAEVKPELILLDINLPVMNGLEALALLSTAHPQIPVVMITSQNGMKTVLEARRLGAVDYVLKYGTKAEVLRKLGGILDGLAVEAVEADDAAEEGTSPDAAGGERSPGAA